MKVAADAVEVADAVAGCFASTEVEWDYLILRDYLVLQIGKDSIESSVG